MLRKNLILLGMFVMIIFSCISCTNLYEKNFKLEDVFYDVDIENGILYGTYEEGIKSVNIENNNTKEMNIKIDEYAKIKVLDKSIYIFRDNGIVIYDLKFNEVKKIDFESLYIIDKIQKYNDGIYFFLADKKTNETAFYFLGEKYEVEKLEIYNGQNYYIDKKNIVVYTSDENQMMKKALYNVLDKSFIKDEIIYEIPGDNFTFDKDGKNILVFDYKNIYKYDEKNSNGNLLYSMDSNNYEKAILDGNNIYIIGLYDKKMVGFDINNMKSNTIEIKIYAPFQDFSNLNPNFQYAVNKLIEKHQNVRISIVYSDPDKYYDDINVIVSSKNDEYDIFYLNASSALNYSDKGAVYNLSKSKAFMKNYNDNVRSDLKPLVSENENYFGIPQNLDIKPIKINTTRLKALGINYDFKDTFTFDDYFKILDQIKKVDEKYFVQNSIFTSEYLNYYIASNIDIISGKDTMIKEDIEKALLKIKEYNDATNDLQKVDDLSYDESELPVFSYYGEGYLNSNDKYILKNSPIIDSGKFFIYENYLLINRSSKNIDICTDLFSYYYDKETLLTETSYDNLPIYKDMTAYSNLLNEKYNGQNISDEELKMPTKEYIEVFNKMMNDCEINQVEWTSDLLNQMSDFISEKLTKEEFAENILSYYKLKIKE